MQQVSLSSAALAVLRGATFDGLKLFLPPGQLERSLYEEVNEVLSRLGGKWKGGKTKAHLFEEDPREDLSLVLDTGKMPPKNPTAFFGTPPNVAEQAVHMLHFATQVPLRRILEPSAGKGALALACQQIIPDASIECCEIVPAYALKLQHLGFTLVAEDFLAYHPDQLYDGIIMNPPFAVEEDKLAWVTHVEHAYELLIPGGALAAIVPAGFSFRKEKRVQRIRDLVAGSWMELPADAFLESGTGVRTLLISITRPEEEAETEQTSITVLPIRNPAPCGRKAEQALAAGQLTLW